MKSLVRILCVLTTLVGASQCAIAAPADSVDVVLAKGAGATEMKYTPSGNALAASTVYLTFEKWDPAANGGQGAWVAAGLLSNLPVGQGVINPTGAAVTPALPFVAGVKYRAQVELKRDGVVKASSTSNEITR